MFEARFWLQILLKNKFWNLAEKTIPKNSHNVSSFENKNKFNLSYNAHKNHR